MSRPSEGAYGSDAPLKWKNRIIFGLGKDLSTDRDRACLPCALQSLAWVRECTVAAHTCDAPMAGRTLSSCHALKPQLSTRCAAQKFSKVSSIVIIIYSHHHVGLVTAAERLLLTISTLHGHTSTQREYNWIQTCRISTVAAC